MQEVISFSFAAKLNHPDPSTKEGDDEEEENAAVEIIEEEKEERGERTALISDTKR